MQLALSTCHFVAAGNTHYWCYHHTEPIHLCNTENLLALNCCTSLAKNFGKPCRILGKVVFPVMAVVLGWPPKALG